MEEDRKLVYSNAYTRMQEDCKLVYSNAYRVQMRQVLDNWDSETPERQNEVLRDYLTELEVNKYRTCKSNKDLRDDLDIVQEIQSKADEYDRRHWINEWRGYTAYYRAEEGILEVKLAMLEFVKSHTKDATVSDLCKSLRELPEEIFEAKAKTLDFCECFLDLDIPEERKRRLLQKSTFESDFNSALDDATDAVKTNKLHQIHYAMKFQELAGYEYPEEIKSADEQPCIVATDMDALKRSLKAMEEKVDHALQENRRLTILGRHLPRELMSFLKSTRYLNSTLISRLRDELPVTIG